MSVISAVIYGIEARPVIVETDISRGLPAFHLTGLPDAGVREARERIRASMCKAGLPFPKTRVTVNLAPGDLKKEGTLYDLPIAISLLECQEFIDPEALQSNVFIGELSLNGELRPVHGTLTVALMAKRRGFKELFVPLQSAPEAAVVPGIDVFPAVTLSQVVQHLTGKSLIAKFILPLQEERSTAGLNFSSIKGQAFAKRGLEIAAAGGHNVLLKGPPGTGKTLLAKALPTILPSLSDAEALEVSSIASVAGAIPQGQGLIRGRPFRNPHHSSSAVSLVGGGAWPRPGEVSLAHRGVLFLDELPEFPRHVLEHLRQPLEDGEVAIARASARLVFPARFMFVAAMNPCPCGYKTDPRHPCTCTQRTLSQYQKRISGPLMDRFDLVIEVPNLDPDQLLSQEASESSEAIKTRVISARGAQSKRYEGTQHITNSDLGPSVLEALCPLDQESKAYLRTALTNSHLSARGYGRVCKVARTIADLESANRISLAHLMEAIQFRIGELNTL